MSFPERRATDPLMLELLAEFQEMRREKQAVLLEVQQLRRELIPLQTFMAQVTLMRKAALWVFVILGALGGAISWVLNVRDHIHLGR